MLEPHVTMASEEPTALGFAEHVVIEAADQH